MRKYCSHSSANLKSQPITYWFATNYILIIKWLIYGQPPLACHQPDSDHKRIIVIFVNLRPSRPHQWELEPEGRQRDHLMPFRTTSIIRDYRALSELISRSKRNHSTISKRHTHLECLLPISLHPAMATTTCVLTCSLDDSHNRNAKTVQTIDPGFVPGPQNNHCVH